MKKGKLFAGTSGWHYKHWKGVFYPDGIPESKQLNYYTHCFKTVEINNSFYMLPTGKTFAGWKNATLAGFIFSVKASRFITHMKKLKADKRSIHKFLLHAGKLGKKLGPVLFQLPPRWKLNTERLVMFLERLPKEYRYTFEFRDHTWYVQETYDLLRQYSCAFCIYELERHTSPLEVTADFVYIRLHGPSNKYQGSYTEAALKRWAERCREWRNTGKDVYIYFDNDQAGYAALNAKRLMELA